MNNTSYIHIHDNDQILCRHTLSESRPDGYPVIEISGSVYLFPTLDRLRRLHQVLDAYLAAHDADRVDITSDPCDEGCSDCRLDSVVAAEAVVDTDDLLHAMASSFEPRRADFPEDW